MSENYPDWRIEELARKYAPPDAYWPDDAEEEAEGLEEVEEE